MNLSYFNDLMCVCVLFSFSIYCIIRVSLSISCFLIEFIYTLTCSAVYMHAECAMVHLWHFNRENPDRKILIIWPSRKSMRKKLLIDIIIRSCTTAHRAQSHTHTHIHIENSYLVNHFAVPSQHRSYGGGGADYKSEMLRVCVYMYIVFSLCNASAPRIYKYYIFSFSFFAP